MSDNLPVTVSERTLMREDAIQRNDTSKRCCPQYERRRGSACDMRVCEKDKHGICGAMIPCRLVRRAKR